MEHVALVVYLALMIGVGLYFRRESAVSPAHYFLGNRSLGFLHTALSAVVSGRSAWLVLGLTGAAFSAGLSAFWIFPGYVLVELLMCLYAAPRLRRLSGEAGDVTLTDVIVSRLGDTRHLIRLLSVAVMTLFYVSYISAQLGAGEKTFKVLFGFQSRLPGMLLTAAIVGVYTMLGGFKAVAVSDAIQALFMLVGLVALPVVAFFQMGGWGALTSQLQAVDAASQGAFLAAGTLLGVVNGLGIGCGSPGNPHILVRYMAIDDEARLRQAAWAGFATNVLLAVGAVCIGIVGRAIYREVGALPLGDKETLFLQLARDTFHPLLAGVVLAALLAAIMSTVDSQILVVSSAVSHDLLGGVLGRSGEDADRVRSGKLSVLAVIGVAFGLYFLVSSIPGLKTIYAYVLLAWGGLGATFGPIVLYTLFWPRFNRYGAIACLLLGPPSIIVAKILRTQHPGVVPYEALPAFAVTLVAGALVSLATPARPAE